jgi:hypothetical protein
MGDGDVWRTRPIRPLLQQGEDMGACYEYSACTPQAPDRPLLGGGVGDGDVRCTGCHVRRNLYIAHTPTVVQPP